MSSRPDLLHSLPGSESELCFFARFWEWEHCVEVNLPRVIEERNITSAFQPIFSLDEGQASPCGYEAFARFPVAPRIPVGLWFRVARQIGLGRELEILAARSAAHSYGELPAAHFLNMNVSLSTVEDVVAEISSRLDTRLVVDLPFESLHERGCLSVLDALRDEGAQVCIDDTPLDQFHGLREALAVARPQYVKIDVLVGLYENPMGRFNLAEAAAWCRDADIQLVAERVEKPEDLELLHDLGVDMAQGYSLVRPT